MGLTMAWCKQMSRNFHCWETTHQKPAPINLLTGEELESLSCCKTRKRKRALENHRKVNKNFLSSASFRCSWEGPLCCLSPKGCAPLCQNAEDVLQPGGQTEISWYSVAIKAMVQGFGCLQMHIDAFRDSLKCPKRLSLCSWQDLWTWKCLGGCKAPAPFPPLLELLFYLPPGASLWVRPVICDSSNRNWKRKTEVRQPSSLAVDLLFRDRAAHTSCLWFGFRDGTLCGAVTSIHWMAVPGPAEGENEARLDVVLQDIGSILKWFQKGVCRSFGAGKVSQQIVLTRVCTPFGPLLPVPTLSSIYFGFFVHPWVAKTDWKRLFFELNDTKNELYQVQSAKHTAYFFKAHYYLYSLHLKNSCSLHAKVQQFKKPLSSFLQWHLSIGGLFWPQWLLYKSLQALPISCCSLGAREGI